MRFWPEIIGARARDEWDGVSLALAAQLAECQCCIEEESVKVRIEGSVIKGKAGPRLNPRQKVVGDLLRREMALMRSLRMGGRISGDARDQLLKRDAERQARAVLQGLRDDELLA